MATGTNWMTTRMRSDVLRGSILNPSVAVQQEYTAAVLALVRRMCDETKKELLKVFAEAKHDALDDDKGGDAPPREGAIAGHVNVSSQARIAMNRLADKYEPLFNKWGKKATKRMMDRTLKGSSVSLGMSLKEMSADVTLKLDAVSPKLLDIMTASTNEAVSLIKLIPTKYLGNVQGAVMRSITSGNGLQDLLPYLTKQYQGNVRHARNVSLDQTRKAFNNATAARMEAIGVTEYEWVHTSGSKEPRQLHIELDRQIFKLSDPPVIQTSPEVRGIPGYLPFCLPARSNVEFTKGIHKLFRRKYRGKLSTLVTESGELIEATGNHPVLTGRGWIAAQEVQVGDYVVCAHEHRESAVEAQVANPVSSIGQLFDAASLAIGVGHTQAGGAALEFHGDISDGEIEVIDVDGFLPLEFDAQLSKRLIELVLAWAAMSSVPLESYGDSLSDEAVMRALGAPESVVRGLCPLLALLRSHSAHADDVRFGLAAYLNAGLVQARSNGWSADTKLLGDLQLAKPGNVQRNDFRIGEIYAACGRAFDLRDDEAATAHELGERVGGALQNFRDLLQPESGIEKFERVVEHRIDEEFFGHVYNIESGRGWYTTNGLIVHNCRCKMRPIVKFSDK